MKEKNDRRSFLKNLTISGLGVTAMPGALLANEGKSELQKDLNSASIQKKDKVQKPGKKRAYNGVYSGEYLKRVAFTIGGMGAGMFCLELFRTCLYGIGRKSFTNRPCLPQLL
jgi:hypothetical protein